MRPLVWGGWRVVRLAKWREGKMTQGQLADALGCSQPFISLIERRTDPQIPSREWMLKIWKLTKGLVGPNDFYDLPPIGQTELALDAPAAAPLLKACETAVEQPQPQAVA